MSLLPDWRTAWSSLDEQFPWIREMKGCPQDAVHHAEGDVWIHVSMVCQAMTALPEFQTLREAEKRILFSAALLHDVAKPECTRTEDGRTTSRGHSHRGAIRARRILWELGVDIQSREQVCALVRYHQHPFYLIQRPDSARSAYQISQTARCDWLAILAKSDALGRECADQSDLLLRIELFREFCHEHACLDRPKPFPSALSRFQYFRSEDRDAAYCAHDDSTCEVILMSGVAGAGKDTWIRRHAAHLPQISLDAIREELNAPSSGSQGAVIQTARERAREFLRKGEAFVWNATNLTLDTRTQLIDLFTAYKARTRIVAVEAPADRLFTQNRERPKPVRQEVLEAMLDRWDVPSPIEAAQVELWNGGEIWIRH